jgi:hypothetical protein
LASSGDLIDLVAELFKLPRSTVHYAVRSLQARGLFTKGKQGRYAGGVVTPLDGARLVTSIAGGFCMPGDRFDQSLAYDQLKFSFAFGVNNPERGEFNIAEINKYCKRDIIQEEDTRDLNRIIASFIRLYAADLGDLDCKFEVTYAGPNPRALVELAFIDRSRSSPLIDYVKQTAFYGAEGVAGRESLLDIRCSVDGSTLVPIAQLIGAAPTYRSQKDGM